VLAAIISTANSLLILSATELSESIIKPMRKGKVSPRGALTQSRVVTAVLSVIALLLAVISPSDLIYTIVGYVWAGIGSTFSVVILLSLFWKRYSGIPALLTIVTGLVFTIVWISTGMDAIITSRLMTFLVALIVALVSTWLISTKNNE
jgi:Na+/proline symporter